MGRDVILVMLVSWLSQVFSADNSRPPEPVNLNLTSIKYVHLLTWQPGPGTPRGVSYNVSVKSSWGDWKPVAGCVLVERPLVCNLTRAFTNLTHLYYSKVVAILRSQASPPAYLHGICPIKDSALPAVPLLTLTACNGLLCVDFHPPPETPMDIYQHFQHQLRVTNSTGSQLFEWPVHTRSLDREVLTGLAPGQKYCVSVRILDSKDSKALQRKSEYSRPQCTYTAATGVDAKDVCISVVCLAVLPILAFVVLLVRTKVVCLKIPLPTVLVFIYPLEKSRLVVPRKELACSCIHIGATPPSAGGTGKCTEREDSSDTEEVTTNGSVASIGGYKLPSAFSSSTFSLCSSSSSFSTRPLLQSKCPPPSEGHMYPDMCPDFEPFSPLNHRSEHWKEAGAGLGPWEGHDDVNLLSLTFGEGGAYRARTPPTADEEEVAMEMTISDKYEEEPCGYLRR